MKRIYIYFGAGSEYNTGAETELAERPSATVYAFVSSPRINEVWECFQQFRSAHAIKDASPQSMMSDMIGVFKRKHDVPFTCYRRINDTQYACLEQCIVGKETALEAMRG